MTISDVSGSGFLLGSNSLHVMITPDAIYTLPETNKGPSKTGHPKGKLVSQPSSFQVRTVSFREGTRFTKNVSPLNITKNVTMILLTHSAVLDPEIKV